MGPATTLNYLAVEEYYNILMRRRMSVNASNQVLPMINISGLKDHVALSVLEVFNAYSVIEN